MTQLNFAKLNSSNIVLEVHVVDDSNAATEAKGEEFLRKLLHNPTAVWKLSDTNTGGASKNLIYDPVKKIFHDPQPYPSWTLQPNRRWKAPIPRPAANEEGKEYNWNEGTQSWDIETTPESGIFEPQA